MKILLDECLPVPLKKEFKQAEALTVVNMDWTSLKNGNLMRTSIEAGFDIFLTVDKNLQHQQNIKQYDIIVVVLDVFHNKLSQLAPLIPVLESEMGSYEKGKCYTIKAQ